MRVLYVDIDSLRPDHLGCYGYDRDTSPTIDALAADGRRFTNCHVTDAPCAPSRTALFSARYGTHTGAISHAGVAGEPRGLGARRGITYPGEYVSVPRALADAGHHTAMISPFPERHDAWHVVEGFEELHDTGGSGHELGEDVVATAGEWLAAHAADDDWFCYVNLWDPHTDYDAPAAFGDPFADDPTPEWLTEDRIAAHREGYGPHCAREPRPSVFHDDPSDDAWNEDHPRMPGEIRDREDFGRWIDGYDTQVRYADEQLGRLLDVLREAGVDEETLVVVTADHGENLGELNVYGDHRTVNDAVANVPLIVSGPGVEPGVDEDFHAHVDIGPTLVEEAGGRVRSGWDGDSFAPALRGGSAGREYVVSTTGFGSCQRSVRWGDYRLIRTYHDGAIGALEDVLLFDVVADPHETTDLSDERPDVVADGLARLNRWHDARMAEAATGEAGGNPDTPDGVVDPMWAVLREGGPVTTRSGIGDYVRRLDHTGREDHARALEAQFGIE